MGKNDIKIPVFQLGNFGDGIKPAHSLTADM